ncbi:GGDEF domain-containing protein [Novosphingobium endophyticum]|nr:GGDEF domain-containing protein [Novosphingobium endophyticum]
MTAKDTGLTREGFMRWFGLGGKRRHGGGDGQRASSSTEGAGAEDPRDRRRRQTLEDISRFLLAHGLPVSTFTLDVAHDIVTGANPALAQLVAERVNSRDQITSDWLEDVIEAQNRENGVEQLHALVHRLESSVAAFSSTATAARTATKDYNTALKAHVGGLGAIGNDDVIAELTRLARDMISRTRDIERELSRSEKETRTLQKSLVDARREAEMDHLTGLPNRRAFEAVLRAEFAATRDSGEPLCVAFCDIDNFKRVNDAHGHEAGDRILRAVALSLAGISNDKCHVARHGGEEFVVLLRGKSTTEAWNILDDARERLAARKFVNRATDRPFGRISFSAGIADVHAYGDPREALRVADEALYRAKSAGRNCVLTADQSVADLEAARAA